MIEIDDREFLEMTAVELEPEPAGEFYVSMHTGTQPFVKAKWSEAVLHARAAWRNFQIRCHLTTSQSRCNPQTIKQHIIIMPPTNITSDGRIIWSSGDRVLPELGLLPNE
jgi:hypothetical protein